MKMNPEKVMHFCIKHNYFTAGNNRQYEAMLNQVRHGANAGLIARIIKEFSVTENSANEIYLDLKRF